MPLESKAQNRFFHFMDTHPDAAAQRGLSKGTINDFIGGQKPGALKGLPERVAPARKEAKMRKPFGSFAP